MRKFYDAILVMLVAGIRVLRSPLGDEGFRMKRYANDNQHFHTVWHVYSLMPTSQARARGRLSSCDDAFPLTHARGHPLQYHADSGDEGLASPRVLAAIFYLNDVDRGGETVFLRQVAGTPA